LWGVRERNKKKKKMTNLGKDDGGLEKGKREK